MKRLGVVKGVVVVAVVISCLLAPSANAFIVINWQTLGPWLEFGTTWTGSNFEDIVPVGSWIQLIWTDAATEPVTAIGNSLLLPGEVLLATHSYQGTPTFVGGLNQQQYNSGTYGMNDATFHAGHVLVRGYDANPSAGDHYLQGGWVATLNADPGFPNDYNDAQLIPGGNPIPVDMTIVPEPCAMALFGLGALTLVVRRKLRR